MATIQVRPGDSGPNTAASLSAAQTGNGVSTNIADRGGFSGDAMVTITTTVDVDPTCTYAIQVSPDGFNWFPATYADAATPETLVADTFAITTATTVRKLLRRDHNWRYVRITYSANTAVTNTADVRVL